MDEDKEEGLQLLLIGGGGEEIRIEPQGSDENGKALYGVEAGGLMTAAELCAFAREISETFGHDVNAMEAMDARRKMQPKEALSRKLSRRG